MLFRILSYFRLFRYTWFVRSLEDPIQPVQVSADVEFRHLTPDGLQAYATFWRTAAQEWHVVPPDKARDWLAEGRTCHAVWCGDRIASLTWSSVEKGRLEWLRREFSLGPDEIYLYGSFTLPEFRGLRIHQANCQRILEEFRAKRFRWAFSLIVPGNRVAATSRVRSGFRRCHTSWTWRIGPFVWHSPRGKPECGPAESAG